MADSSFLYPFQDVPGLLTPEMQGNVRTQSLLGAAAGLLNSAGWSPTPVNMWQALGAGLQGGVSGYQTGTNDALKQLLTREQIGKLELARKQAADWQSLFGMTPSGASAAPAVAAAGANPVPSAAPQGLLTPPGPVSAPTPAGARPPVPSSPTVWGDKEAENAGLYDPAGTTPVAPTGPVTPQAPTAVPTAYTPPGANGFPTQRDIRSSASGGLAQVVADMPAGIRQMIALAGPEKGREILAQWVGKAGEKPSDTFITAEYPNGQSNSFRADSPELDAAIRGGAKIVSTPAATSQTELVTAQMPNGETKTFRRNDPALDAAVKNGATMVSTPAATAQTEFVSVQMPNGGTQNFRRNDPALDAAVKNGATIVSTPNATSQTDLVSMRMPSGAVKTFRRGDPNLDNAIAIGATEVGKPNAEQKPDNYILANGQTVLSDNGKTYVDADGTTKPIPSGAIKLGPEGAFESARQAKVQARAQTALANGPADTARPPAEAATAKGTGPISAFQSATNAVLGGVGLDKAIGKEGLFRENEANRNYLLTIRQVAKTALINNPRMPVKEQDIVDSLFPDPEKFWTNPRTEVDKIPFLRNTLQEQLRANNEAIAQGALTKEELSKLTQNNQMTERALRLLGPGPSDLGRLGNPAAPAPAAAAATPATQPPAGMPPNAKQSPQDGKWYVPDPARPGKYLRVSMAEEDNGAA